MSGKPLEEHGFSEQFQVSSESAVFGKLNDSEESPHMVIASSPQEHQPPVLDRLLDPAGRCLTRRSAQALLKLQADADLQTHIEDLARKSTAGRLTAEERSEYEALIAAGTVISILKSKAHVLLAKSSAARG